ncbi:MAG: DNA-binding GntR family transcriptional regulator [Porticoccaceae bacterium]
MTSRAIPVNANNLKNNAAEEGELGSELFDESGDVSPWRLRFNTIYKNLRKKIILLTYPPGTRLDVNALAQEHGVSRTPIRTVIQRLENEGLAITRHGVGTLVTDIDLVQVREAMLLRMHLAELIGQMSPRLPEDAASTHLESSLNEFRNSYQGLSPHEFARADMKLHDYKCSLIGNQPLRRTYDDMYYRTIRAWFFYLPKLDWPTEHAALTEDFDQTIKAIKRGDVAAVGYITRNAISAGLNRLNDLSVNFEWRQ